MLSLRHFAVLDRPSAHRAFQEMLELLENDSAFYKSLLFHPSYQARSALLLEPLGTWTERRGFHRGFPSCARQVHVDIIPVTCRDPALVSCALGTQTCR